jgi:DNA polymerase-3 subunit epsilon
VVTTDPRPGLEPSPAERDRARADAIYWAATVAVRSDVFYLDTETTGLDGQAEIIEIALIDNAGTTLLDTLIRPAGCIPKEVTGIHGIDDAMVARAPRWLDVYPGLAALLREKTVIVYNADFDLRLLNQTNQRCALPQRADRWECAMRRYAAFAGEHHPRYGGYRWHKLDVALASFGHAPSTHRARGDALACRLVVAGMAAALTPQPATQRVPGPTLGEGVSGSACVRSSSAPPLRIGEGEGGWG